ncbi:MAG: glycosyltransferase [Vicinamibacterales bacterium]
MTPHESSSSIAPRPLKVLLCHSYYQQRGGEDESFEAEAALLEARGHDVVRFTRHNDALSQMPALEAARLTFWNSAIHHDLGRTIARERPDVMHCTNTFPLISPSAHYAAAAAGVPVVQSLRNFRLLCPGAFFLRDGHICEDCALKPVAWPGVQHRCYRNSRAATAVVALAMAAQRTMQAWRQPVALYFTPSAFARSRFLAAGFPANRVAVKPNFVAPDPGIGPGGDAVVFVGRLSAEKGVATLLSAWQRLAEPIPLQVIGEGPLADDVRAAAQTDARIQYLGRRPLTEVLHVLGHARAVVVPSIWYETFGRTVIEAFARGTPVVASRVGSLQELVDHGRTGLLAATGDADDLASSVRWLVQHPDEVGRMRAEARREYETRYTADTNYALLTGLYERARRSLLAPERSPSASAAMVEGRRLP